MNAKIQVQGYCAHAVRLDQVICRQRLSMAEGGFASGDRTTAQPGGRRASSSTGDAGACGKWTSATCSREAQVSGVESSSLSVRERRGRLRRLSGSRTRGVRSRATKEVQGSGFLLRPGWGGCQGASGVMVIIRPTARLPALSQVDRPVALSPCRPFPAQPASPACQPCLLYPPLHCTHARPRTGSGAPPIIFPAPPTP